MKSSGTSAGTSSFFNHAKSYEQGIAQAYETSMKTMMIMILLAVNFTLIATELFDVEPAQVTVPAQYQDIYMFLRWVETFHSTWYVRNGIRIIGFGVDRCRSVTCGGGASFFAGGDDGHAEFEQLQDTLIYYSSVFDIKHL